MKLGWIRVGYVYFNGKLNTPDLRCGGFDNLMAYFQFKRRKHSETINERCKIVKYVVHDERKMFYCVFIAY